MDSPHRNIWDIAPVTFWNCHPVALPALLGYKCMFGISQSTCLLTCLHCLKLTGILFISFISYLFITLLLYSILTSWDKTCLSYVIKMSPNLVIFSSKSLPDLCFLYPKFYPLLISKYALSFLPWPLSASSSNYFHIILHFLRLISMFLFFAF